MLIDLYSDLHLSSWKYHYPELKYENAFNSICGKYCIIAGDNGNGRSWTVGLQRFLENKYEKVFIIYGNHDWYHEGVEPNQDVQVADFEGVKVVGCTLWSNFRNSDLNKQRAERGISDFYNIHNMTGSIMESMYYDHRAQLLEHKGADIVVTHFPPLIQSEHSSYFGDPLNPYFVNHDPELVKEMNAKYWCHGHVHNKFDYQFLNTHVLCGPIGYCGENSKEPVFKPLTFNV